MIEAEDLRWYLEEYYVWPIGVFEDRAERIEKQLPVWGQDLYQSALTPQVAQAALNAWLQAGADGERRFSVFVDSELPEGAGDPEQAVAREAASELPDLPHEFQGRSRELLALERLLHRETYAVVRGQGGAGKTTLAAELARWLVRQAAFVARAL